jgi:hypothetical protein
VTQEPRPPEPEQGTVEWAEWATRISREDPDEWKRIRDRTRTEFREQGRELFGALRFVVKPIIWAIAVSGGCARRPVA